MSRQMFRKLNEPLNVRPIEFDACKFIDKNTKITTFGSCFAYEVNLFLNRKGYKILNTEILENKGEPNLIWYNTYSILYEFQRVTGEFKQDEGELWMLPDGTWQDPYRRLVMHKDKQELCKIIKNLDEIVINSIKNADCIVITLGLTETWFLPYNNKAICACPGYARGGGENCYFRNLNFMENYENMMKIVKIIKDVNKNCKIILTVSPVPLAKTFTNNDHMIANTYSKNTLRSVAGLLDEQGHVSYFHSYEMALGHDRREVFIEDARHIRRDFVDKIMGEFEKKYVI